MLTKKDHFVLDSLFPTHLIVDALPNAIFIKNEDLRFVFVNKAYESMFGVKMADMLGKTVLDLTFLPEKDRDFYHNEDREMVRHQETSHHVFQYQLADGKTHTCLYWSGGFAHEDGSRGLVGVIVDITSQSKIISVLQEKLRTVVSEKREIEEISVIDSLTRLHNRRFFEALLQQHVASAIMNGSYFSCIIIDIDHFKKVNDAFGHLTGDEVLKNVAQCFKSCSRYGDVLCRYGGEEFVLLLPGCRVDEAAAIAERVRLYILETVSLPDGTNISVSAGCSEYIAGEEALSVVQRADEALYIAKKTGRNRICTTQHQGYSLDE